MQSFSRRFFCSGNLTFLGALCVVLFGFGLIFISLEYFSTLTLKVLGLSVGLGIAAIGGFSGRANALDLKPFTSDPLVRRKAKESYKTQRDSASEKTVDE